MLFHAAVLAVAATVVAMGSRTPNAHGLLPPGEGATSAAASHESAPSRVDAAKALATAEKTWIEAHRRRDAALLRRLLASEFTFTAPDGRVCDTNGFLSALGNGAEDVRSAAVTQVENRNTTTRVYGTTAVVTGETIARDEGSAGFQENTRFLRVYVHRDGRWQMVAGQDTALPSS
jgi:hypothetical protein